MTTADGPEEFRDRWNQHISELEALKHSIPPERWDELDAATDDLRELVDDAATEVYGE